MTKAPYYPPADRTVQWFGDDYPGSVIDPRVVVLHSTETSGWPGYGNGASAPHFTCRADFVNRRLVWRQHFRADRNARALRNPSGGVETNLAGALQVEIVGTCDRNFVSAYEHLRTWELPAWAIRDLALFIVWAHDEWGITYTAPGSWPKYPNNDNARLSGSEWLKLTGVCGHLHVPENTHQDPGDINIKAILDTAKTGGFVALTDADLNDVWDSAPVDVMNPQDWKTRKPLQPVDNPVIRPKAMLELIQREAMEAADRARELQSALTAESNARKADVVSINGQLGALTQRLDALADVVAALDTRIAALDPVAIATAISTAGDEMIQRFERLTIRVSEDTAGQ